MQMKKTFLLSGLLFAATFSFSQSIELHSQTDQDVTLTHQLKQLPFEMRTINGQSCIDFGRTYEVLSMENGAPALPLFHTSIQLPDKGNTVLVVEYDQVTEIQNVSVAPSKGNLKRNIDPSSVPYTFGEVYNQDAFYPANVATLNTPFVWRAARGQVITLSPYQYNPVTKVLRIHENLRVRVIFQSDVQGLNEIATPQADPVMAAAYKEIFINPTSEKYAPVDEEGELLIIADPNLTDALTPFVRWKTAKGIKTTLRTTNDTGTTDTQIKSYIQTFYGQNPGLAYVLLVGDHGQIPAHTYGTTGAGEELWSDSYYGQLAGGVNDFYPEVFVGRFPAASAAQAELMVDRTIDYELTPAPGNWMEKAIGLASNEGDGIGDDGEIDYEHMRNIRTRLMSFGYSAVYEFYEGSQGGQDVGGNPNSTIILPAINEGVGLFNYTGHGSQNMFVTGNFTSTNINQATNVGMYPFVISVACNNGTFTDGSCLGESFLRADDNNAPAGGIAFAGSSILMAWAPPMQTQDEMTEIIAEAYPNNRKTTLGGLFYNSQMSMLEEYPGENGEEVMQTWVLFGDPSTVFRNRQTMNLNVTHVGNVPLGTTSLTVNCDVDGAEVAISQNHVLIGKGTVSGGNVQIPFDALVSDQPLTVTATKQNYRPYQGPVQVGNGPLGVSEELAATVLIYPNPASAIFTVEGINNTVESAELFTIAGQSAGIAAQGINGTVQLDASAVAAGSYLLRIVTPKGVAMKRIEILR